MTTATTIDFMDNQNSQNGEPLDLSSGRFLNETAIRDHALECSKRCKGGKFTRVGQDFIDEVKADAEGLIRELRAKFPTGIFDPIEPGENSSCLTGAYVDKVKVELNRALCRLIQLKVQRQPSVGKTLSRTR